MNKTPKIIEVFENESWINVVEYPGETLKIEGIRQTSSFEDTFAVQEILLSKVAVKKLYPLMRAWVKGNEKDI